MHLQNGSSQTYTDADTERNLFETQASITNRPYTSQIFKSMSCNYWVVNLAALLCYFAVNAYESYKGDQIVYAAAALTLSNGAWLQGLSCGIIMYSLRYVGIPSIVHLIRAFFVAVCFWICRFPQLDYKLALVMAAYNFVLFIDDGAIICESPANALPPMLPHRCRCAAECATLWNFGTHGSFCLS